MSRIADMMQAQASLMQQFVNLTVEQRSHEWASKAKDEAEYQDPHTLLNKIDPDLRSKLLVWLKEFRRKLSTHATQQDLLRKYSKVAGDGELLKSFQDEAKRDWQWPKFYLAAARPLQTAGEAVMEDLNMDYSLSKSWQDMRLRHAKECQAFVLAHQRRSAELAELATCRDTAKMEINDIVASWLAKFNYLDDASKQQLRSKSLKFLDCVFRHEVPKCASRIEQEKEKAKKAQEEHDTAQARYDAMDIKVLIAAAAIEVNNQQKSFKKDGVLEHLTKSEPEIADELKKQLQARGRSKNSGNDAKHTSKASKGRTRTPTPRRASTPRGQSRSSSRARSTSRSASRTSSRAFSSRSATPKSKKVRFVGNAKGKGKGKGRGKSSGGRGRTPSAQRHRSSHH